MKKITLFFATLLVTFSVLAETTVETLWEKSETTSSKPAQIGTIDYRDFGYFGDTIYLQDKVNSKLYLFDKNGAFLSEKQSAAYHAIDFDDVGNLISANFPVSNLDIKLYDPEKEVFTDLTIVPTGARADFPTVFGNMETGAGAVYAAPKDQAKFFRANFVDGVFTTADEFPLTTSSPGQNYIIPVDQDNVIVCLRSSRIFYYDMKAKKEGAQLLSGIPATASIGGTYFEYDEEKYLVQACSNSTNGNYMGAFKIYNITDPTNVEVVFSRDTDLGKTANSGSTAVHFEAEVKPDGVFIYQFVPKNGLAAYKFHIAAETEVILPTFIDFSVFDGIGESETSGSAMPKIVPMEPDAFGYESGNDTIFVSYKYGIDTCSNVYAADGKIKLSTSKLVGSFQTLPVNTGTVGKIKVEFRGVAWAQTSKIKNSQLQFTYGNQKKTIDISHKKELGFPVTDDHLTPYYVTFDAIETPTPITVEALGSPYDMRVFMDDFAITEYVSDELEMPIIEPKNLNILEPVEISITAAEGLSIRYTQDGTDPSATTGEIYTGPFTISTTQIVKAIAYNESKSSPIATASYNFPTEIKTIAELRSQPTGVSNIYKLTGEAVLTLQSADRGAKYIQDATGAILIDDYSKIIQTVYALGDGIKNICGTLNNYNNMLQFIPVADPGAASSTGNIVTPKEVELANLSNYEAQLVRIKNVKIAGTGNFTKGINCNLNDAANPVLRPHYSDLDYIGQPIPKTNQDIVGVVMIFKETTQFIPRSLAEFTEAGTVGLDITQEGVIYSTNGKLYVPAVSGEKVEVYSITGQKLFRTVATGETIIEGLTAGEVVIVKTTKKAVKVIIR